MRIYIDELFIAQFGDLEEAMAFCKRKGITHSATIYLTNF